jgi:hypothetical protein
MLFPIFDGVPKRVSHKVLDGYNHVLWWYHTIEMDAYLDVNNPWQIIDVILLIFHDWHSILLSMELNDHTIDEKGLYILCRIFIYAYSYQ